VIWSKLIKKISSRMPDQVLSHACSVSVPNFLKELAFLSCQSLPCWSIFYDPVRTKEHLGILKKFQGILTPALWYCLLSHIDPLALWWRPKHAYQFDKLETSWSSQKCSKWTILVVGLLMTLVVFWEVPCKGISSSLGFWDQSDHICHQRHPGSLLRGWLPSLLEAR